MEKKRTSYIHYDVFYRNDNQEHELVKVKHIKNMTWSLCVGGSLEAQAYTNLGSMFERDRNKNGSHHACGDKWCQELIEKYGAEVVATPGFIEVRNVREVWEDHILTTSEVNKRERIEKEKDLEERLIEDIKLGLTFKDHEFYGRQITLPSGRLDVLLRHKDTHELLVLELKRDALARGEIGQVISYIPEVEDRYPGHTVGGALVAGSINTTLRRACSGVGIKAFEWHLDGEQLVITEV
jgi:hypothetical protein